MGLRMETGQVVIRKRGAERIRRGHLWIYGSDILKHEGVRPGGIVAVCDERGALAGKAFYSSKSQISLRLLTRSDIAINEEFFHQRFAAADQLRERLNVDPLQK